MTRGEISAIAAVVLIALIALGAVDSEGDRNGRNGSETRTEMPLVPADSLLRVAWVIRDRDCASCASPAYIWRRVKALYGDSLDLFALVIGSDTQSVRAVLRDERIGASIAMLRDADKMDLASPSMLLLRGRTVKQRWTQHTRPTFVRLVSDDSGSVLVDAVRAELKTRR